MALAAFPAGDVGATLTPARMQALPGAPLLGGTVDQLLKSCGLPDSIVDADRPESVLPDISWRGVRMRLSAGDWTVSYGMDGRDRDGAPGWTNPKPSRGKCLGVAESLAFTAKGGVGILTVRPRSSGRGYDTSYVVPEDPYRSHKVIGVRARLAQRLPASALLERYGRPDEILPMAAGVERHRYWVLTRYENRPDTLHAVDFHVSPGDRSTATYDINAAGTAFVDEKFDALLREWERDYVFD